MNLDGIQLTCIYQYIVRRGPCDLSSGLLLVELVYKNLVNLAKKFKYSYLLAKFTKCFRQVQQVKVLNKDHEDLC